MVILMGYSDYQFTRSKEEFSQLFNTVNFKQGGNFGSVRDFFFQNSYEKLTTEFVVIGPFTSKNNRAYYRDRSRELCMEAVEHAIQDGIQFEQFDNTGDQNVDAVTIIFAGQGRESGGGNDAIWSHASRL